jgi:hypothetical protein
MPNTEGYTIHPLLPLIKAAQQNLLAASKVDLDVMDLYWYRMEIHGNYGVKMMTMMNLREFDGAVV